jgi:hypothetical protein
LAWKTGGKRPLLGPNPRREGNIKIYSKILLEGVEWIVLAQDRDKCWAVVIAVMNPRVP